MAALDSNSQIALGAGVAAALYGVSGAGLKIGIISDSYNNNGGAAADVTAGYLPSNVQVVSDLSSGGSDEGRAMMELAYKIAPGATFAFATGYSNPGSTTSNIQSCANAVAALQAAGCNIIIDDLGFGTAEAFYQTGTVLDNAITTAVNAGISYFSAAGNDGKPYYEQGFTALSTTIAGIGTVVANDFGSGSPYLSLTIAAGQKITALFEWAQPFASIGTSGKSAQNSLAIYLLDSDGNIVASSTTNQVGSDPTQTITYTVPANATSTAYRLVVVQNGGTVPSGQAFKFIFSNGGVVINNANANTGTGDIYGHELLTNQNSLGAVNYAQTPAFGVSPPTPTDFTSVGPGALLFDSQGNAITPKNTNEPNFSAAQGSNTSVTGFAPFNGTSAAAPNAGAVSALALQVNRTLTTTQLTSVLAQSAIPETSTLADTGAGLIQARAAVELAASYAGTRWTVAAGGNWATAGSWSTGALPTTAQAVSLDDNLGTITSAYTITVNTSGNVAGSLTVGTPSGQSATLIITSGGVLAVGGPNTSNPTANDFLVSNNGVLSVTGGTLTVAGSLNLNNGTATITTGAATADNEAQNAGRLTIGGGSTTATLTLTGGGLNETGGTVTLSAKGTLTTTTVTVSSSTLSVAANATLTASGAVGFTSNSVFSDSGSFVTTAGLAFDNTIATVLSGGSLTAATLALNASTGTGTITDAGTIIDQGALTTTAGSPTITLQSGGTLSIGTTSASVGINMAQGGTLIFTTADNTSLTTGETVLLSGFISGNGAVDYTGLTYAANYTYSYATGQLTIFNPSGNNAANILLNAADGYNLFTLSNDGSNGLLVKAVPCYCRGTAIATATGEALVETLSIGDLVRTHSGALRPILWLGRRAYDGRFAAGNPDVLPVRIRAGALADGVPQRDLLVSPQHAMLIDGMLIPACALVNGQSIIAATAVDTVEYIHIELADHDIILAEGAPAETFVDDASRNMFHNAAEFRALYPDATRRPAQYCAPRIEDGAELEAVRNSLESRAATLLGTAGPLEGHLDLVTPESIEGWARDPAAPDQPVRLRILDGTRLLAELTADLYRPDLEQAGIGLGRHAFSLTIPGGLEASLSHTIHVERVADGQALEGSPCHVAATQTPPVARPANRSDTLDGQVDVLARDRIAGWAIDRTQPGRRVSLTVFDNGTPIASVVANAYRPDLHQAGLGDGRHAFDIIIPGGLSPLSRHLIQIRHDADGADLPGTPVAIEPSTAFDPALEQAVAIAVTALVDDAGAARALAFMAAQTDRLLQQQADRHAQRTARQAAQCNRRRGIASVAPTVRALVIDERMPAAGRDAGSHAILSHMQSLQRLGYDVSFIDAGDGAPVPASAAAALAALGITCCAQPFATGIEDVLRRQAGCFDLVYIHRASVAARYMALARAHMPQARILYSVADLAHLRLERQAAHENDPAILAASRHRKMTECLAAWSADAVLTHSPAEADLIRRAVPHANVHVVPWSVPTRTVKAPRRHGVAFVGHFSHAPNEDAARWLLEAVMPIVWQTDATIPCLLAGHAMPAWLRTWNDSRVQALGPVPDLATLFDQVALSVAPLRFGAGIKGKVLDSLAAGLPCVMTPIAAEGLLLAAPQQALVAQDAGGLAAAILRLHTDSAAWTAAQKAGLGLIRGGWSNPAVDSALLGAIGRQQDKQQTAVSTAA